MNKKLTLLSAAVFSVALGHMPLANADEGMHHCKQMEQIEKKLDLNADQKTKLKAIKEQARTKMEDEFKQIHDIRHQINEQIAAGSKDQSKIDDLVKQETDVLTSVIKDRIAVRQQIYDILTDKQRTKFQDMLNQWEEKHLKDHS